jgi:hypothetical protein
MNAEMQKCRNAGMQKNEILKIQLWPVWAKCL